jgi:hypothetical protein
LVPEHTCIFITCTQKYTHKTWHAASASLLFYMETSREERVMATELQVRYMYSSIRRYSIDLDMYNFLHIECIAVCDCLIDLS